MKTNTTLAKVSTPICFLVAAVMMAFCPVQLRANTVLTWTLNDVAFDDGGTASGMFDYDADTNTYSAFSISVAGGDPVLFPDFAYTLATSHLQPPLEATDLSIYSNEVTINPLFTGASRFLFMTFAQPLTNQGGSIVLQNQAGLGGDAEFSNPLPSTFGQRSFISGTVSSVPKSVPDLGSSIGLLSLGLLGLAALRRKLQVSA